MYSKKVLNSLKSLNAVNAEAKRINRTLQNASDIFNTTRILQNENRNRWSKVSVKGDLNFEEYGMRK